MDSEGTGSGIDIEFTKKIANSVSIPVLVHGGIGNKKQIVEIINKTNVDGISIASMFHYNLINEINFDNIKEGNIDYLKNRKKNKLIEDISIRDLKSYINKIQKNIIRYE